MTIKEVCDQRLFHGASPGRWMRRGASITEPTFKHACFMSPSSHVANMYCADWRARSDQNEFLELLIEDVFEIGDYEELESLGFIEVAEDGHSFKRSQRATAKGLKEAFSSIEISHLLIPLSLHTDFAYPERATIFPLRLRTDRISVFDCEGHHFDNLPGLLFGMKSDSVNTDEVVNFLKGTTDVVWFRNLTDPAHIAASESDVHDTVFAYSPNSLVFDLTGEPADLI